MKGTKTLLSYILFIIGLQWKSVYALPGTCDQGEFLCHNKNCIVSSWTCDGEDDCGDKSDELNCDGKKHRKCDQSTNFQCKNSKCVPLSWTCDYADDCGDGSDESSVDGPLCVKSNECARDDFKCKVTGRCILKTFVCDGDHNCGKNDTSDESDCKKRTCNADEMRCDNGRCISKDWVCDKNDDCLDASDEKNCSTASCPANKFKCIRSGHCIAAEYRCDGGTDCLDGSDEKDCVTTTTAAPTTTTKILKSSKKQTTKKIYTKYETTTTTTKAPCKIYEFTCSSTKKCIHNTWLCDGELDCDNGEDELKEVCQVNTCNKNEYRCSNGQCIDSVFHCDGKSDCHDGSDEKNCSDIIIPCTKETYHCKNSSKCIDSTLLCNKKADCPMKDDESDACGVNECAKNKGGCSHICKDLAIGHECKCNRGYALGRDNKTCIDVNECLIPGTCSQVCVNYKGSFACECDKGYVLDPVDKKTCRAKAPIPYLVFSNRFDIRQISTNGHDYKAIITDARSAVAVALDVDKGMVYWADNVNKTICRTAKNGDGKVEVLVDTGIDKPEGLAIDWIAKKLYWSDSLYNRISVSNLDGSHVKVLINSTSDQQLRALAVYPEKGLIYWTDWGKSPKIERANLDGTDRKTIVTLSHVTWPSGITIDHTLNRLYWTDLKRRHICSSAIDGSDIKVIVKHLSSPFGLTVFEDHVYWTDYSEQKLFKANKFTGRQLTQFKESFFAPMDINVYHPLVQKQVSHPCQVNNGGCTHLCFISASSKYSCDCPDLLTLDKDGKTCVKTGTVPTISPSKKPVKCTTEQYTCKSTQMCISRSSLCDGKPDCPEHEDEKFCGKGINPTVINPPEQNRKSSAVTYTVGTLVVIILIAVVIGVILLCRKRRNRFDLKMTYETKTEIISSKDGDDKANVEVKYVTNTPRNQTRKNSHKNFDNVNYKDESKMPLQMSEMDGDTIDDQCSDNSSADVCFDDTKPIIAHMV
ncbi:low-density lipoprotein receptor-like [Hydractinia symbiolongicarpus]|uniref:low-density lipoprotein receptor-like n=1 Tax=Hydractinia symbiolongicarpus TaxID=13093 RepID=UPI00254B7C59|nr:low-density lipoprotein receptor-like [Hydractinia symbiolongicarpus]